MAKEGLDFILKLIEQHGVGKAIGILVILGALGFVGYLAWLNLPARDTKSGIDCLGYGLHIRSPGAGWVEWGEIVIEGTFALRPSGLVAYTAVLNMDAIYPQEVLVFQPRDYTWSSKVHLPEYMYRTKILVLLSVDDGSSPFDRFYGRYHEIGRMEGVIDWDDERTVICDSVTVTRHELIPREIIR